MSFFHEPQAIRKMLVLRLAVTRDLFAMGQRMDRSGVTDILVQADARTDIVRGKVSDRVLSARAKV